eukprot:Mrub_04137.p4 GENE.Mrub_04137~~Mrub_04137.p4  ORF type:complete len:136 (+),score=26.35 Mrub_04137:895-1302(+)
MVYNQVRPSELQTTSMPSIKGILCYQLYEYLSNLEVYEKEDNFKFILQPMNIGNMDDSLGKLKEYISNPATTSALFSNLKELYDWIDEEYQTLIAENNPESLEMISQLSNIIEQLEEKYMESIEITFWNIRYSRI